MIYGLPTILHMQHHSSTIKFLLCNLSIVRIFRSAADHVKNATLVGTLTLQILFQGKF